MSSIEVLILFFGFQAFLLGAMFLFRMDDGFRYGNQLFAIFLFLSGWLISYNPLFWSRLLMEEAFIHFNFTYVLPLSLIGPFFFFYIRYIVTKKKISLVSDFFHFIPFIYFLFSFWPYYVLSTSAKLEVFKRKSLNEIVEVNDYAEMALAVIMISYTIYIFKSYLPTFKGGRDFKLWLKSICSAYLGIALSLVVFYVLYIFSVLTTEHDYMITITLSFAIFIVSYFSFNYQAIFYGSPFEAIVPFTKYEKTGLSENYSKELKENLLEHMVKDKPFLDGDLRLDHIANSLGISRHHASQIINEHFKTNFFDFINVYRTEEAISLIEKNLDSMNLAEISFLAGFNNTVSFNKAFKKNTGLTPSKFRKQILSKENQL